MPKDARVHGFNDAPRYKRWEEEKGTEKSEIRLNIYLKPREESWNSADDDAGCICCLFKITWRLRLTGGGFMGPVPRE